MPRTPPTREQVATTFGKRLAKLRREAALTQEQLALKADLNRTFVGSVERGEKAVTVLSVVRLARALGVDPAELVRGL